MLETVYNWIKNIAFYMLLVTAFLQIVPDESYRKYIRFFSGLILIMLLVMPIFKITGLYGGISLTMERMQDEKSKKEMEGTVRHFEEEIIPQLQEEYNGTKGGQGETAGMAVAEE